MLAELVELDQPPIGIDRLLAVPIGFYQLLLPFLSHLPADLCVFYMIKTADVRPTSCI